MKISRDQGVSASLATVVSAGSVIALVWLVVKPLLLEQVSAALADDIKSASQTAVAPLKSGFVVILQQQILSLQKTIAQLERKQRTPQGLTEEETNQLVDIKAQLDAQENALRALLQ